MNAVDRRDPVKTYHKQSLAQIQAALPDFNMDEYLQGSGAPDASVLHRDHAGVSSRRSTQQIKTRSLDELKSYLRWWTIKSAANKTTPELEQANFDFFGTDAAGDSEDAAAVAALRALRPTRTWARRWDRST